MQSIFNAMANARSVNDESEKRKKTTNGVFHSGKLNKNKAGKLQ